MRPITATFAALLALLTILLAVDGIRFSSKLRRLAPGRTDRPAPLSLVETHKNTTDDEGPLNMRVYDLTLPNVCQEMQDAEQALAQVTFCKEVVNGKKLCTPDIDEGKKAEEFKLMDEEAVERYLNWVEALPQSKREDKKILQLVKKYSCLAAGFIPKPSNRGPCSVIQELGEIELKTKEAPLVQAQDGVAPAPAADDDQAFFLFTTTDQGKCPEIAVNDHTTYQNLPNPDHLSGEPSLSEQDLPIIQNMASQMQAFFKVKKTPKQKNRLRRTVKPPQDEQAVSPQLEVQNKIAHDVIGKSKQSSNFQSVSGTSVDKLDSTLTLNTMVNNNSPNSLRSAVFAETSSTASFKQSSKTQYNVVALGKVPHDQIVQRAAALVVPGFLYDDVFWKGVKYPDVPEVGNQYTGETNYGGQHIAPKAWYKDVAGVSFDGVVGKLRNCGKLLKSINTKTKLRYNWVNCMNWKVNFREQPWHSSATPMILMKTDKVDPVTEFENADGVRAGEIERSLTGMKYKATITNRQARHLAVGAILRWVEDCLQAMEGAGDQAPVIEAFSRKCNRNNRDNVAACKCKSLLGHAMHTIADSFPPSHTHRVGLPLEGQDGCDVQALPTYKIEDFYSVDVQDPFRHKLADNVYTDSFAWCATAASAGVITLVLDAQSSANDRLHNVRDFLCDSVYPMEDDKLALPAGGAPASLSGNFMVQKPTQVVNVPGNSGADRNAAVEAAWRLNGNHLAADPNQGRIINPWQANGHPAIPDAVPYDDLALEKIWDNVDVCAADDE